MPIIQLKMNINLDTEEKHKLLLSISHLIAEIMNKPVSDVMVLYSYCDFIMAESLESAAFVDIKCISGLDLKVSKAICEGIFNIFKVVGVQIEAARIYINFFKVSKAHSWRFINGSAVCPAIENY